MTHPDQSEQQLRRALRAMNDLQPPTDELFVQRAVIRGRARTNRRRNTIVAAAAALVVIAGGGGAWLLQGGLPGTTTASSASAPEVMSDQGSQSGAGSGAEGSAGGRQQPTLRRFLAAGRVEPTDRERRRRSGATGSSAH